MDEAKERYGMIPEVATIAKNMFVLVDGERWQAKFIAIERYVPRGPQWVHLIAENRDQSHTYLIDRKKMVNAWIHLVKGEVELEGMVVKVDGVQWKPTGATIEIVDGIRSVTLSLKSPGGVSQKISIDFDGLVAAYYALRTKIELVEDMQEVTQSMIGLGDG